jgi:hypothetical protein
MRCVGAILFGVWLLGCASSKDDDDVDKARCGELREHLIDLRLKGMTDADVAAHRTALQQAMGDDFIASCQRSVTSSQMKCTLGAVDSEAAEACRQTAVATKP